MLQKTIKKIMDIIIAFSGIVLLSPVLVIIYILILINMGLPGLFRQLRPGLNGHPFIFYKFRTMTSDRDADGVLIPDQCRLTSLGVFLRKTSLDELPQLWNVLRGDMSIVGPRPLLLDYLQLYTPEQARRHEVRPGIVGWAGVNGRNANSWDVKLKMDIWYIDNWSIWLDLRILLKGISVVLSRQGINEEGYPTASRFGGSSDDNI